MRIDKEFQHLLFESSKFHFGLHDSRAPLQVTQTIRPIASREHTPVRKAAAEGKPAGTRFGVAPLANWECL